MNTFFIHINNHATYPSMKNVKVKRRDLKPSYTIAGIQTEGHFHIGIAQCSPFDQFCKKVGRVKAEGRAKSYGHNKAIPIPEDVLTSGKLGAYFVEQAKNLVKCV